MTDQPKIESAPNVWLMGDLSSGKTTAIRTLVNAGVEVFLIPTEPGYTDILGDIPPDKLHWHYIQAYGTETPSERLKNIKDVATLLRDADIETIKKMPGAGRNKYGQFFQLLETCNKFVDDRTGKDYGDTLNFTPQQALVLDGLSGLNNMVARLVAGNKPCMSWPEYDAAQFTIEQFINTMAQSLKCWFIVTSHIDLEPDPLGGGTRKQMPQTIGQKLAPKITKFFSEVIVCKRTVADGKSSYIWDNFDPIATVKNRNLPQSSSHRPDFGVIKGNWEKKVEFTK